MCYVVPGHDLLSSAGPTRNVINLARAMGAHADVAVAFRRLADANPPEGIRVLEIEPGAPPAGRDDSAVRGMGFGEFYRYLRALRRFVDRELGGFDVVLEKNWLLSGYVSYLRRRGGQLAIPIENIVPNPSYAAGGQLLKRLRLHAGRWLAGYFLRGAPLIIAETQYLRTAIARYWRVPLERIVVVDLGVDRTLFRPIDQAVARARLGIAPDKTILVYVGVLDRTHNLDPAITAFNAHRDRGIELHIVGDGPRRRDYEAMAASGSAAVVFHGLVPHQEVPWRIAVGDLCIAPYDSIAFPSGELGYATLKIPEYMSVGRAVVSVPSGRILDLVREGETGFLMANEAENWRRLLANLPSRERLRVMGAAAAAVRLTSWGDTAAAYFSLCEKLMSTKAPVEG